MSLQNDLAGSIEFDTSSIDDYDSVDEFESESASAFDSLQASKSYWLGKMFMRFAQAHAVLRDSSPEETVTEIDVKLEERLRRYPYCNSLKSLQECVEESVPANLRPNTNDDYEAFLCAIGHILARSAKLESQESRMLFRGLQYRGDDMATRWTEALETKGDPDRSQSPEKPLKIDSGRYYDELKYYAHRIGEEIRRKSSPETLRQGSRRWTVTLTLKGREFVGKDSKIEEAVGKAAQRGCEAFELEMA